VSAESRDAALILRGLKNRVDRLEREKDRTSIPNPIREARDRSNVDDTIETSTSTRGDGIWNESRWGFAEWS